VEVEIAVYKTDLIRRVAKVTRLRQTSVNAVLTASLRQIGAALAATEAVVLPGFGTFTPSQHRARAIRDVGTGRTIMLPARGTATFRSDHGTHEAIYLHDPDFNGIELAWDRPQAEWPRQGEHLVFARSALDFAGLLGELNDSATDRYLPTLAAYT
jgi:nucleoid DNA-binding protein